ncbi:MAG TPA: lysophospholipid acyltransferase family protein [Marmoricola sp.]|nr:lysophospholipid acyltransferase family protein [Marmoricola sp.]
MSVERKLERPRGWAFSIAVPLLKPPLVLIGRRDWRHAERIPLTGGAVVAVNHISKIDPLMLSHLMYNYGRLPRFLAKDGLFKVKVLGGFLRAAGQIPVAREGDDASVAFMAAVNAVKSGEAVMFYPEGSITRDPDGWPMRGKTGAARVALMSGAPVIPIGQWGAQETLPAYSGKPSLLPRHIAHYNVGDPVDLDDLRGKEITSEVLQEATDRIMAAITELVAEIRGGEAPKERFDPRRAGLSEIGKITKVSEGDQ